MPVIDTLEEAVLLARAFAAGLLVFDWKTPSPRQVVALDTLETVRALLVAHALRSAYPGRVAAALEQANDIAVVVGVAQRPDAAARGPVLAVVIDRPAVVVIVVVATVWARSLFCDRFASGPGVIAAGRNQSQRVEA